MAYAANSLWWHPSGAGPVNPNTYGARQPQTAGGSSSTPGGGSLGLTSPFAFMPPPGAPKPVWLPKSLGGTGGVGAPPRPGTTAAAKPKAPTDPWQVMLRQLMASYETPAQQTARVNKEIDAQIAAQKKLLDDEYAREQRNAQAMAQGMSAAGAAAAAMSKDLFGQVGGEFNAGAKEIKGLSHSLTGAVGKQTGKDVGAANAELSRTGAPTVGAGGGGMYAPGGMTQAGVEDYRSGILPGQMLSTQGEAANFGLAGLISSENMKATEEAKAALMKATQDINDNQNKAIQALAAGRGDLYHTYMNDAQDAQVKRISLAQGIQAAQQSAKAAGYKTTLDAAKLKLSVANFNRLAKGQTFDQKMATIKENRMQGTAGFNQAATTKRLEMQAAKDAIAAGQVDVNRSKATGKLYNKAGVLMTDSNGKAISSKGLLPNQGVVAKKGQLSQLQLKNMVESWHSGKVSGAGTVPVVVGRTQVGSGKNIHEVDVIRMLKPGQTYKNITTGDTKQAPGAGKPKNFQEAFNALKALGVDPLQAQKLLISYYKRGENGRTWLTAQERQILADAGVDPRAHVDNSGNGYLNRTQVAILRGAGALPAGNHSSNHSMYWIKPAF